jgi:4-hydroxy-3-methylbut-2-enyl diphosphate reductase
MKIIIAKTAGFCMGVRRAVEMALDAPSRHSNPIFTYGPLIHNPQVLELLEEKGVHIIRDIPETGDGTVLIRAHGVPPSVKTDLRQAGFTVIDATCPRVIKVQTIIRKHAQKGYAVIIIGDRDHPEVTGLLGFAGDRGYVAGNLEELASLPAFDKAILVAQTTLNTRLFEDVKSWVQMHHPDYECFHTICDSTAERQAEVRKIAGQVDALIVVGGCSSGNTQRLAEISRRSGIPTFHIETEADLDFKTLSGAKTIGITAGASTPNWIINRVVRAVERVPNQNGAGVMKAIFTLQQTLLMTNVYVAAGAGCLCYTCAALMKIPDILPHAWVAMLYVLSMHTLNNLTGLKSDRYNDPDRGAFYHRHRLFLICLAMSSGAMGLLIACTQGAMPFLVLLMMSVLGLSYNLRLIPERFMMAGYSRIRDIPGSKTILIAVAWGMVTSALPAMSSGRPLEPAVMVVFLWSTGLAFVRTAFFDILDMQGDRIVGKETIPILLGEARSIRMLRTLLLLFVFMPVCSGVIGVFPPLGYGLAVCPAVMLLLVNIHENGFMLPGIRLEFLVESLFILAGAVTLLFGVLLRS